MEITIITNPSPTSANVNATTAAAAPLPHPRTQRESLTAEFLSSITFNSACANANDELLQVLDQQQPPPSLHPIPFYKRRKHSTLFSGGGVAAAAAAAGGGSGSEKAISSLLQRDASSQYTGAGGGGIASRLSDLEGTPVPKLGLGKRKSNSCIPPSKNEDPHHLTARSLYCSSSDHHHAVSLHSLLDQSMTALNGRFILLPSIRYTASISATSSDQGGVTKLLFASNSGTPLSYFSVITNTDSSRQNYKRTKAKSNRTFAMIQL